MNWAQEFYFVSFGVFLLSAAALCVVYTALMLSEWNQPVGKTEELSQDKELS